MSHYFYIAFSAACWLVAGTSVAMLLHPRMPTDTLPRTVGLGGVTLGSIILASWGNGSGGNGTMIVMFALALLAVDYLARKYASAHPNP